METPFLKVMTEKTYLCYFGLVNAINQGGCTAATKNHIIFFPLVVQQQQPALSSGALDEAISEPLRQGGIGAVVTPVVNLGYT